MRLGVFGGTFDPPHAGHLILAAEALDQLRLDRVLWVVTADPPHKKNRKISPAEVRFELVRAALQDSPLFEISRVEIDRPPPQYTFETVRILAGQNPCAELFYLMGGDSLRDLPTWKRPAELISALAGIAVMRRPDATLDMAGLEHILPGLAEKTHFVDTPLVEISSTGVRQRIAQGRHYRYFLPPAVFTLIEEKGLYR